MTHTLPPVLDLDELRAFEALHAAQPLMERAGLAAAEVARAMLGERGGPIVVLAGPGNNGGDALVVARHLRSGFHDVVTVAPAALASMQGDAATARDAFLAAGGAATTDVPLDAPRPHRRRPVRHRPAPAGPATAMPS